MFSWDVRVIACSVMIWYCFMGLFFCLWLWLATTGQQGLRCGEREGERKLSQEASYLPGRGWKQHTHTHIAHSVAKPWFTLRSAEPSKPQEKKICDFCLIENRRDTQAHKHTLRRSSSICECCPGNFFPSLFLEEVNLLLAPSLTPDPSVRRHSICS